MEPYPTREMAMTTWELHFGQGFFGERALPLVAPAPSLRDLFAPAPTLRHEAIEDTGRVSMAERFDLPTPAWTC